VTANRRISIFATCAPALIAALTAGACRDEPPASAAVTTSSFAAADVTWIETTIAMDQQILPLLTLAQKHSRSANIRATGLQVQALTDAELPALRQLATRAGVAQSPLPRISGTITAQEISRAATLSDTRFDTLIVRAVRDHLETGRDLASDEQQSGAEDDTRELAAAVLRTRTEALKALPLS
jgi:uncharacterized protein (DUF305 family)